MLRPCPSNESRWISHISLQLSDSPTKIFISMARMACLSIMSRTWFPVERRFVFSTWPKVGQRVSGDCSQKWHIWEPISFVESPHLVLITFFPGWTIVESSPPQYDWGNKSREWGWLNPKYVIYRFIPSYVRCSSPVILPSSWAMLSGGSWSLAQGSWFTANPLLRRSMKKSCWSLQ